MNEGHRHSLYCQAAWVWGIDDLDFEQWLYYGSFTDIGRDGPLRIDPEMAATMEKVKAEMPWLTSGIPQ